MTARPDEIEQLLRVPSRAHRRVLGWLFILLALLAVSVIGLRESSFLRQTTGLELTAYFKQGHSLRVGSKVLLAEVQIGEVQNVKLLYEPLADTDRINVEVKMQIKGEYASTLPVGTEAEIRFAALDFANAVVLVPPDTPTGVMLARGAVIPTRAATDMIEEVKTVFAKVSRDLLEIVGNLKTLSDDVTDTHGSYNRIVNNLIASTRDIEQISHRSRTAFADRSSAAGVLLNENAATARQIERTVASADRATENINRASERLPSVLDNAERSMETFRSAWEHVGVAADDVGEASEKVGDASERVGAAAVDVGATARGMGSSWLFGGGSSTKKDTTPNPTSY